MEKREITIPESAYPAIRNLVALTPEQFEALIEALLHSKPAAFPQAFSKNVSECVPQVDASKIVSIVEELFTMDQARGIWDVSVNQFADLLGQAANSQNSKLSFNEEERKLLDKRIKNLFETKSGLTLTAKAAEVIADRANLFYHAKIYTDVRPIFDDSGKTVHAMVILHSLRMHYKGENGDHKDIIMALDASDLKSLRTILDRAEQKAGALRQLLDNTHIDHLDFED